MNLNKKTNIGCGTELKTEKEKRKNPREKWTETEIDKLICPQCRHRFINSLRKRHFSSGLGNLWPFRCYWISISISLCQHSQRSMVTGVGVQKHQEKQWLPISMVTKRQVTLTDQPLRIGANVLN